MAYINLAPFIKNLQILIMDVDGVLTSGRIIYNSEGIEHKRFNVTDGLGIVMLRDTDIKTAIITGRESDIVDLRARELGIDYIFQGYPIKLPVYEELKRELHLPDSAFGFIGDDLIDLDVMRQVGFSATPSDAHPAVKENAHYVCRHSGGAGAVREVIDLIFAFRRGEFDAINYIPVQLLEHWQDIVWKKLSTNGIKKEIL